jgi:hypothetical protein
MTVRDSVKKYEQFYSTCLELHVDITENMADINGINLLSFVSWSFSLYVYFE